MDVIREHLQYKNSEVTICMQNLTQQERYECIRLIMATGRTDVSICRHEIHLPYIDILLKDLPVRSTDCSLIQKSQQTFDRHS
jgi:hypothetical protein